MDNLKSFLNEDGVSFFWNLIVAMYEGLGEHKVDKEDGKGLSQENYTTEDKEKLSTMLEDANKVDIDTLKVIEGLTTPIAKIQVNDSAEFELEAPVTQIDVTSIEGGVNLSANYNEESYNITGSGRTTVSADEVGNVTIHSDETIYTNGEGIDKYDNGADIVTFSHPEQTIGAGSVGHTQGNLELTLNPNEGQSFTTINLEYDKFGHVIGANDVIITLKDTDTNTAHTHIAGVGLDVSDNVDPVSGEYTYKVRLQNEDELENIAVQGIYAPAKLYPVRIDKDGNLAVSVPWDDDTDTWKPNTKESEGYVTKPAADDIGKVWKVDLNGNPSWEEDNDTTYETATSSTLGLVKVAEVSSANSIGIDGDGTIYLKNNIPASSIQGTLSLDNIPAAAIEKVHVVANSSERFALTSDIVQVGDTVKETSTKKMYYVKDIYNLNNENGYEEYVVGLAAKADSADYATKANALDVDAAVGTSVRPVYINASGIPTPIDLDVVANTDYRVRQTIDSSNSAQPILFSSSTTTTTEETYKNNEFSYNPSTKTVKLGNASITNNNGVLEFSFS